MEGTTKKNDYGICGAGCLGNLADCFSETSSNVSSVASDERKACGCHPCTTEQVECSTGEVKVVADGLYYAPAKWANDALNNLVDAYNSVTEILIGLRAENKTLREQVAELMDESVELDALQQKLREMVK